MSIYTPLYYEKFRCLADKCPDSCCAMWEIVIDEKTLEYYNTQQTDFSEVVRKNITVDEDGDSCFMLKDGRCPFLNKNNLCDIHINMGEEHTCEVCKQHPRFIEEYDGFTEMTLSLSCPEASRVIFGNELSENTYPVPESDKSDELLDVLIEYRTDIIKYICNESDINKCFDYVIDKALELQNATDGTDVYGYSFDELLKDLRADDIFSFMLENCEILTDEWKILLQKCIGVKAVNYTILPQNCRSMLAYFLYRYFLKSINDYDIIGNALFCILSVITSFTMSEITKIPFEEIARLWSKEIEHDTDNVEIIKDHIADAYL